MSGIAFAASPTPPSAPSAPSATASFAFCRLFGHSLNFVTNFSLKQRLKPLMRGLDSLLSFHAILRHLFRGGMLDIEGFALLGFVDHYPLELFFFVKEIRDVEKRVALES